MYLVNSQQSIQVFKYFFCGSVSSSKINFTTFPLTKVEISWSFKSEFFFLQNESESSQLYFFFLTNGFFVFWFSQNFLAILLLFFSLGTKCLLDYYSSNFVSLQLYIGFSGGRKTTVLFGIHDVFLDHTNLKVPNTNTHTVKICFVLKNFIKTLYSQTTNIVLKF